MNIPISVSAVFNTMGEIAPRYVQMEDETTHTLTTYKVLVEYVTQELCVGIGTILFSCFIDRNGRQDRIKIRFNKASTK